MKSQRRNVLMRTIFYQNICMLCKIVVIKLNEFIIGALSKRQRDSSIYDSSTCTVLLSNNE